MILRITFTLIFILTSVFYSWSQELNSKTTTARETVLFEIGTNVGCSSCTSVADAMDSLVHNGKNVSVIKYHFTDQFETVDGKSRVDYYDITATPVVMIDGKERINGGAYQVDLYPEYLAKYEDYIAQESTMEIEMELTEVAENSYTVEVTVTELEQIYDTKKKLRLVLTESNINYDGFYNDTASFVCRDMLKDANGFKLDFSDGKPQKITIDFNVDTSYHIENCNLIAFVQHDGTQEVLQAVIAELPYTQVGIHDQSFSNSNINLYPNPVSNKLFIKGINTADRIEIRNISGQLIYKGSEMALFINGFNTRNFANGLYMLTVYSGFEINVIKFVK
ncbi:MAG: Omp28-related outer membrane protein [Salinivirgaceae bacterium]|nr:Omp28-related outer membrane protein [Salinivirgaceae bacterium]